MRICEIERAGGRGLCRLASARVSRTEAIASVRPLVGATPLAIGPRTTSRDSVTTASVWRQSGVSGAGPTPGKPGVCRPA